MTRNRSALRKRVLPLVAALGLVGGLVTVAQAANPADGTVTPTTTTSWNGKSYVASFQPDDKLCPSKSADPNNSVCDHYLLTVTVPSGYWTGRTGGAVVTVSWPDAADDWDLFVYKNGGLVTSSATGNTRSETLTIPEAVGTYEVRVEPFMVTNSGYTGTASIKSAVGTPLKLGGPAAYHGTRITGALPPTEPQNARVRYSGEYPIFRSTYVGRNAAEPTIGMTKEGNAFFPAATFDGPGELADTRLLRTKDFNISWQDITPPLPADLPVTLDPYVYVEEDSSRVFDADLYLGSVYLSFSDDQGRTFKTNPIGSGPNLVNDHQSLFAGPRPAGAPAIVPPTTDPKFPELLYYCFNRISDSSCSRSSDGGVSFVPSGAPAYPGVNPATGDFCGGLAGHVGTDRKGNVYLPRGYCGTPFVSVSKDAGTTWTRVPVSNSVKIFSHEASITSDRDNNLYYTWVSQKYKLPFLATSKDGGRTWSKPLMIAPPDVREAQFVTVAGGKGGGIGISFMGTTVADEADKTRPWDLYTIVSLDALAANPLFISNVANPGGPTDPIHRGDCPDRCGNVLDFLDAIISPYGNNDLWASGVDTCTTKDQCSTVRKKGFVDGGGDNAASDMKGFAIHQIGGPHVGPFFNAPPAATERGNTP